MSDSRTVLLKWARGPLAGEIAVTHGLLAEIRIVAGEGAADGARFNVKSSGACVIALTCRDIQVLSGGKATRVSVAAAEKRFTFFLRDVTASYPVWLPAPGVIVTTADDGRTYDEICAAIYARRLLNGRQGLEQAPEESFENIGDDVRSPVNETWLGLSRDMRIFRVNANYAAGCWGEVHPFIASHELPVSEKQFPGYFPAPRELATLKYRFWIGRGSNCAVNIVRRLSEGCLPILRSTQIDGDIRYELTMFAAPAEQPLTAAALEGTPCLVADYHAGVHVFTPEQHAEYEREAGPEELRCQKHPLLLFTRLRAFNTAAVPRYAWFKTLGIVWKYKLNAKFPVRHTDNGFSVFTADGEDWVFGIHRVNGRPMAEPEQAVLVMPGEAAEFEMLIPHRPLPLARAGSLRSGDFMAREHECRVFWREKLARAATLEIPEKRIREMVKAGLLHLDLIAYGREPDGPLAPAIGPFAPLAFESVPILLAFDRYHRHDLTRRALEYYLFKKQQANGRMHNYAQSMGETGPILYGLGEHYRMTGDRDWFARAMPHAIKACEYLIGLRRQNQREENRGRNYGLYPGGVCDNVNPDCMFVNNGYASLGLARTAEWLQAFNPGRAAELAAEAAAWRADIRTALADALARSPAVPLGDGAWCSSVPPIAEGVGNYHLFCDGQPRFSHGVMHSDDVVGGPLWLAFHEVMDPREREYADILLYQTELFMKNNVAMCQPYISRHDYAHLLRDEVKAFLKYYYNGLASQCDRETYTWNEHSHGGGTHKVEEEAWFLMQTRWMLLLEEGRTLHLLRAVPRAWLAGGQRIGLNRMPTYFGDVSLTVDVCPDGDVFDARYAIAEGQMPERIRLRLPHPRERYPSRVTGGIYDRERECVVIEKPPRAGAVRLEF